MIICCIFPVNKKILDKFYICDYNNFNIYNALTRTTLLWNSF